MKGFLNRFSGSLVFAMFWLVFAGIFICLVGNLLEMLVGLVIIFAGVSLLKGLKGPDQSKGKKAWIITFLSRPTDVVVNSLTMLLDWLPISIIGYIEVDMKLNSHTFESEKELKFTNGYLTASAPISYIPNGHDGEQLFRYVNSGGPANVITQMNGLLTGWLQWFIALGKWNNTPITYEWMEIHGFEIGEYMKKRICGEIGADETKDENSELDDIRNLGITITSFMINFTAPKAVRDARNEYKAQQARIKAQGITNRSYDTAIKRRAVVYGNPPTDKDQAQILTERSTVDTNGNVRIVLNPGGLNLTQNP